MGCIWFAFIINLFDIAEDEYQNVNTFNKCIIINAYIVYFI